MGSDCDDVTDEEQRLIHENGMAEPRDRCAICYIIFYLLGLGSLLPWNFFITANEYWMYKLRDVNGSEYVTISPSIATDVNNQKEAFVETTVGTPSNSSVTYMDADAVTEVTTIRADAAYTTGSNNVMCNSLQSLFMNSLALCAMLPNVLFQFLNTLLQKRIPQSVRVFSTLAIMIVLFMVTVILVQVDTSSWQMAFFSITLVTVVLLNSCSAVFQSSVFGLAACFPQRFSGAVMTGQGMGGVFAALAMIVALAFSNNPATSAFIFFIVAIGVITLTMVLYGYLTKQKFYKHHTRVLTDDQDVNGVPLKSEHDAEQSVAEEQKFLEEYQENIGINGDLSMNNEVAVKPVQNTSMLGIAKRIWLHMFCVTYTFVITLACFPAVTSRIKAVSGGTQWTDVYFTPVCCFLLFNLSDWIGRTFASYVHIPSSSNKLALTIGVFSRSVFPVLFMLCNAQPRRSLPVIFNQDWYFVVFMFLFGFSNGHFSTLCMQYGPREVELRNASTAGSMLAFMISVGLLGGALLSFVLTMLI